MKLIILDRDGVINQERTEFVKTPQEWIALPGSLAGIARLSQAGWYVVIATNQSGLARGHFDMAALHAMHDKLRRELVQLGGHLNAIFLCPHGPDDGCLCRKPLPGMFHDIARRFDINLTGVPAVGDSLRDLQACAQVGCQPWLVRTGNGAKTLAAGDLPPGTLIADDLAQVADRLLIEQ